MYKCFGELTNEERGELMAYWWESGCLELLNVEGEWVEVTHPCWHFDQMYRRKPCKPSINWEHVDSKWSYIAVDKSGEVFAYERQPIAPPGGTCWRERCGTGYGKITNMFSSFKLGSCNWKDSLICRPC